jgi:hypothetical protein
MNIPKTSHLQIKYRNGEDGILLTTWRDGSFPVMTLRIKDNNLIYHDMDGNYMGLKDEHLLDIVEIV